MVCLYSSLSLVEIQPDLAIVEVLFVDYGNTEVVQVNTLREMTRASKHLKTLPFQAIECQLHALPPLGGSWTASAMYRFLELAPPDRLVTLKVIDSASQPPAVEIFIPGEVNEEFLHSINQLLLSEPEIFMPDDSCSDTVDEDVLQESQTDISLNQSSYSDEPDNSLYITVDEFSESAISDLPNMDASATGSEETLSLNNNTDVKNQNAGSAGVPSERPQSTSSSLGEISAGGDGLCCQLTVLSLEDCDTLPRPPLLQIPKPGDYLDVHVSLVFNPGNFVCVPYESMEETLELMAQMSVFYTKVPNAKVSIDKVTPGDLLAGVLEGVWYRVEVRALVGEQG
ncbi:tudor domain-containing protein 7B-like [Lingula anatina]|uniref:Tudor domain-containing protein 7B-like n=1 Tax=Lingula anatina TaxID=7574 RepID=A0A2R2MN98_LINAN|nr:tudor domain-containing protein 7B-like [Lingula anatina]|eukprot:XP_023931680.1 tudor domain-containing protein 7B-like [Lingula anatina]